jgi:hypothetical protein
MPLDDSSEAFRDMEDFALSLTDGPWRIRLLNTLSRVRPFRRFKDAIEAFPRSGNAGSPSAIRACASES